jgi:hypothetical protein
MHQLVALREPGPDEIGLTEPVEVRQRDQRGFLRDFSGGVLVAEQLAADREQAWPVPFQEPGECGEVTLPRLTDEHGVVHRTSVSPLSYKSHTGTCQGYDIRSGSSTVSVH